ncbi:peptide chain release factor N(5)-glutamine methyltransferase [Campylobacter concisus]|uniref:peptide chain release factor N(5)-glutamine methyltransferase n=1 Tax=Campylobacter concisus TaxID=199 RepID=UPI000D302AD6|nr:peptide chain release factor N(5)-glutamine methyltransferase [Campylobacter concisus]
MKIEEALKEASLRLSSLCQNPSRVAKILLMNYLDVSIEWIFLNQKNEFDESSYFALVKRYENYEPLEYITGKASFYGLDFYVESGVLIPRPETEILVDKVIEISREYNEPKIAEIGIGSGIISIMLALKTKANIVATDINEKALILAKKNADKFDVGGRIKFLNCSYVDEILEDIDILVSNPPYIARSYKLSKFVLNEPESALFGGEVGDEILKDIILIAKDRNIKNVACEMGYDQKASMQKFLEANGFEYSFYKDLAGFDRGFSAKLKI